jgi:hypothetical protein
LALLEQTNMKIGEKENGLMLTEAGKGPEKKNIY